MTATAPESNLSQLLETVVTMREGTDSPGSLAVLEATISRDEMSPLHVHEEDEAFHVLEGSIVLYSGDTRVRLEAGDAYLAPKGVPHAHRADGEDARYLSVTFVRSVSRYEDFLRAVAPEAAGADSAVESAAAVAALAAVNRIAVLGPPGTLP